MMRAIAVTVVALASVPASGQTVTFDPASLTPMGNAVYFAGTQPTVGLSSGEATARRPRWSRTSVRARTPPRLSTSR